MKYLFIAILLLIAVGLQGQYIIHNPYDDVDFTKARKSNLQMHTIESDGSQTVQQRITGDREFPIAEAYYGLADSGYVVLSITDHDSYETAPTPEFSGADATFPWHKYNGMTGYDPTAVYLTGNDTTSIYYSEIGDGVYAIMGNELTDCSGGDGTYYTHIDVYFADVGFLTCPVGGFDTYLDSVRANDGLATFNHPGRHTAPASFYNDYFDNYGDVLLGIEIHNYGDYYSQENPRVLWDSINAMRSADSLVWGFSNSDNHQSAYTANEWKNYNHHFLDTLTEAAMRANLSNGAFTASWAGYADGAGATDGTVITPMLTEVSVSGSIIEISGTNYDSIRWFDNTHDSILTDSIIDVSLYPNTNFVRAELYKDGWITYTQPFGVDTLDLYYVRKNGNDSNTGRDTSISGAFATFQKAIETAVAGSTVWIMDRDGDYTPTSYTHGADIFYYSPRDGYGNIATAEDSIVFENYPNESPAFDLSGATPPGSSNIGLYLDSIRYVTFKGLEFTGLAQAGSGPDVNVIEGYACGNMNYIELNIHDNGGAALRSFSGIGPDAGLTTDTTRIINCDFIRNNDQNGNYGDGVKYDQDSGAVIILSGNRSFFNSDDGYDISGSVLRIFYNNWAFGNGWVVNGNGNGFKFGAVRDTAHTPMAVLYRNVSAYNHETNDGGFGFDLVDQFLSGRLYYRVNARFYNNIAYKNDIGFEGNENITKDFRDDEFRNNISYASTYIQDLREINVQLGSVYQYPESHNTWDWEVGGYGFQESDSVTMNTNTWLTNDSTTIINEMLAPRKTDGSLPDLPTAFQLSPDSDLINAGTTNGFAELQAFPGIPNDNYAGASWDLGAFEFTGLAISSIIIGEQIIVIDGKIIKIN
jgi:hypothetical protein